MTTSQHSRARRQAKPRSGMTVIEVLLAMMLLSFGLLAMAGFTLALSRQAKASNMQAMAAMVVQSRFDSAASIRCQALAASGTQTGSMTMNGLTEKWVIADGNDIKSITDTVRFKPRTRPLVYKSIIPCRD